MFYSQAISKTTMLAGKGKVMHSDIYWMRKALALAEKAQTLDEVPVGAILVQENRIVAQGYNLREKLHTPLGHAELLCLHRGSQKLNRWRLDNCTLYVTLEPCVMCAGALVQSRIPRLVFGAWDPKGGACESLYKVTQDPRLNHRLEVLGGILEQECGQVLKDFFRRKRVKK